MDEEISVQRQLSPLVVEAKKRASSHLLTVICEQMNIDPAKVERVLELGCGKGWTTGVLTEIFKHAVVDAIDMENVLENPVKGNGRVIFHQGEFTQVLASGAITPADIVVLLNLSASHNFKPGNIDLLRNSVARDGLVISNGENGQLETLPHFLQNFNVIQKFPHIDAAVWKPITTLFSK